MDITKSQPVHQLTTVVVYGGVAALILGFTAYVLYRALPQVSLIAGTVAIVGYGILAIIVAISWIKGIQMIKDADSRSSGK